MEMVITNYNQKDTYRKFRIMVNMKGMSRRCLKIKTAKNEIKDSKDIKDIPNTSCFKTRNQTTATAIIRKHLLMQLCRYPESSC